jgi:hypothetical protein
VIGTRWFLFSALALTGCPGGSAGSADAAVYDYTKVNTGSDKKALIYNLIGRWFPEAEIHRLDDDTMTPEQWCAREPARIEIFLDDVEVYCQDGSRHAGPIARVDRTDEGITIVMRASDEAKLKTLTFAEVVSRSEDKNRPKARVLGSPCSQSTLPEAYARFPKIERLEREILNGRNCAMIPKP